jgi:hypothetical protein
MSVLDKRMAEIAAQRRAERGQLEAIEESTAVINERSSSVGLWLLVALGIACAWFTFGVSLLVSWYAMKEMNGGAVSMVQAVVPTSADAAAPGWGCVRVVASALSVVLAIVALALIACVIYYALVVMP